MNLLPSVYYQRTELRSSWETNNAPAGQETPWILCNSEVHYFFLRRSTLFHILIWINSVHFLSFFSLKIRFNIILPSTPHPHPHFLHSFSSVFTATVHYIFLSDIVSNSVFTLKEIICTHRTHGGAKKWLQNFNFRYGSGEGHLRHMWVTAKIIFKFMS